MVLAGFAVPTPSGHSGPDAGQVVPFFVVGGVFMAIGGFLALIGLTISMLIIVMGWRLIARKSYRFCITMAAIECVFMPLGTILGILTIFLLADQSVKESFQSSKKLT